MSEVGDIVKIMIEKGGFKTFLASILGAILFYKLILDDWLWSVVVLCSCYLLFSFIVYVKDAIEHKIELSKKKSKKVEELKQDRIARYNRLCIVYNSLPKMTQQSLIELYKLPQETYSNVRILNNMPFQHPILQVCCDMLHKYHIIDVEESLGSYIITIDSEFNNILASHVKDFE